MKNIRHKLGEMYILDMASSDSQIDKPQHGRPKRAELPDVNINTGVQSINTESCSGKTGPLPECGSFISRILPEYFLNIFTPRKTFPYYGIGQNYGKLDFPTIFPNYGRSPISPVMLVYFRDLFLFISLFLL